MSGTKKDRQNKGANEYFCACRTLLVLFFLLQVSITLFSVPLTLSYHSNFREVQMSQLSNACEGAKEINNLKMQIPVLPKKHKILINGKKWFHVAPFTLRNLP